MAGSTLSARDLGGTLPVTTVHAVRDAEAEGTDTDAPLNPAGIARAAALYDRLKNANVGAIYAGTGRRDRMTAAPLAEALGLTIETYDPDDPEELAERIFSDHLGGIVFVVGPAEAVHALIAALGGRPPRGLAMHDVLFEVRIEGERASVWRRRYGARAAAEGNR
jgi:phosphohistidine phosphatase SixA